MSPGQKTPRFGQTAPSTAPAQRNKVVPAELSSSWSKLYTDVALEVTKARPGWRPGRGRCTARALQSLKKTSTGIPSTAIIHRFLYPDTSYEAFLRRLSGNFFLEEEGSHATLVSTLTQHSILSLPVWVLKTAEACVQGSSTLSGFNFLAMQVEYTLSEVLGTRCTSGFGIPARTQ